MKLVYKSCLGILLTGILFVIGNWIYEHTAWPEDRKKLDQKLLLEEMKNSIPESDLLYFAESSNATYGASDSIRKSISQFTNDCFPGLRIKAIEQGALHAGVFKKIIRYIPEDSKLKGIIVTMNLRSFGTVWINSFHENFCQRMIIANNENPPLFNKMRMVFKMYDYKEDWERQEDFVKDFKNVELYAPFPLKFKTITEWDTYLFQHPVLKADGTPNYEQRDLACHNVKAFAFNIDTLTNPRIKDFDEIVEICKAKNLKLYFTIMPENTEYADSLTGKEVAWMMEINKNILVERYSKKGATMIDNLKLVDGEDYLEQQHVSEHYNQRGRMKVARNIAKVLKKEYPEYYNQCE
jgi:hypothetical protein